MQPRLCESASGKVRQKGESWHNCNVTPNLIEGSTCGAKSAFVVVGWSEMRSTFPVAVHIFFVRDKQVLLLRRFNTGYEDGNYSVVAGHVEAGERVTAAAIREAKEEVGVDLLPKDLRVVGVMHRKSGDERVDFFLAVTNWQGELTNCEPHKCDEMAWFPLNVLPTNIIPYVRQALHNYHNSVWFDEFGWA